MARIVLLRALDPRMRYLVADKLTAQLEAHIQAQVWQVLLQKNQRRQPRLIVFSHNQTLLEKVCSRIWMPQHELVRPGL